MEEIAGIPAAYRSCGPTFDVLWAEPWAPPGEEIAGVEAALRGTLEGLPSAVTDVRWPNGWTGAGGAAAADLEDLMFLLLGSGSLADGTVVRRLPHALDPWRTEPYGRNDLGFLGRHERLLAAQAARLHGTARATGEQLRTLVESDVRASLTVASSAAQHPGYV